jgi:hypothetical protein
LNRQDAKKGKKDLKYFCSASPGYPWRTWRLGGEIGFEKMFHSKVR